MALVRFATLINELDSAISREYQQAILGNGTSHLEALRAERSKWGTFEVEVDSERLRAMGVQRL